MALDFRVISLEKDLNNRHYVARIEFQGRSGKYEIFTDANMRYLEGIGLSILDGFDLPFDGGLPYLEIMALNYDCKKYEKGLREAIFKFIEEECSEKT